MAEDEKNKASDNDEKTLEQKEAVVRVEQDNRVQKVKAEAMAAGGGPSKPEKGVNQDG